MSDEREELERLAAAHALDALDPDEASRMEELLSRSAELRAEVAAYREVSTAIALAEPMSAPPEGLKARLFERIREEPAGAAQASADAVRVGETDESSEGGDRATTLGLDLEALEWTKAEIAPGFLVHWLRHDEGTGELAVLLKGEPGATLPDHAHPGGEHFFILHGAFSDQYAQYKAGDFRTMAPGSEHRGVQVTGDEPCILLVITGPGGVTPLEGSAGTA